ncbi:MAG: DISARM system SNF2-like helicase DrmD [Candidatus Ozemobacteraceae bacterium]
MLLCPEVGQQVLVRRRAFVVTEVIPQALPPSTAPMPPKPTHLVKLSSIEDDGIGEEAEVIWEIEPGAEIRENSTLPEPTGFDDPKTLEAFLDAVRWGAVSQADDRVLQSPFRSGIEIDEYQLDPVVRALTMPRVNLLIADDVGLGKTIEAGLVVQELILRHRVRSVLVVCPSSLQIQWRDEMHDKFGLEFRIIDSEVIGQLRRKRGIHTNPWKHFPRLITSIDFLKRERPLRLFREILPSGDQPTYPRQFDLLIVDEAHNVAPSGRGKYAIESQRTMAIRMLASHFEHKLFLTATPHNGYRESFAALLELLDNQRFARAIKPDKTQLGAIMVRRMKSELKKRWDGRRRFAERLVLHLEVPYTPEERKGHQDLKAYSDHRLKKARTGHESFAAEFVLKLLKKRMFSSPAAFLTTLAKHHDTARGKKSGFEGSTAWRRQIEDADEDFANDEEYETATEEALISAGEALSGLDSTEDALLKGLKKYAETASQRPDSKAASLIAWLHKTIRTGGKWGTERVIIFTEYRDTQKWLFNLLAAEGLAEQGRLMMLFGGMPPDERERIKAAFQAGPKESPVRILLATDAASEGVNLQRHCSKLIHYEIPWNPTRMEQRNGRIDRHGQKADEVHIHHFVGKGFQEARPSDNVGDLEADLEFLMRAALKVENIREDLGKVGPVIAGQVEEAMLGRRTRLDTSHAEREAEPVRQMLRFERQLQQQLTKLATQLNDTRQELHLEPATIENVVKIGLTIAGQPGLIPANLPDVQPAFHLPAFSAESWRQCCIGLEHPHTRAIRPIVFDAALATGRDDVVLAHLNHRLVQMCLRLLRAEIWKPAGQKKIHRVTARMVPGNVLTEPAVIAHGRIVVLGGDNHRLHEEVIIAGGTLKEGRFKRMNVGETKDAYAAALGNSPPMELCKRLQELWPSHQEGLFSALEARMEERTKNLAKTLDEQAEKEVDKMRAILGELQKAIQEELGGGQPVQLLFEWTDAEREQRVRDESFLRRRLEEIPREIEEETAHLRDRFRNPVPRLFPISITYLVPPSAVADIRGGRS